MKVNLIAHTPNPDRACAAAAYTTFTSKDPDALFRDLSDEKAHKILRNVIKFGHTSVIEHASFTFSIEGVSRACTHQLVRHRIASYSQQSQRYVKYKDLAFIIPPKIEKDAELKKLYLEKMKGLADAYKRLTDAKIPAEDARYLFPNAAKSNIVVTMNARALLNFFRVRCCENSQWEIRELANRMLDEVKKISPVLFEKAGPSCVQWGYCPEGERGCGKVPPLKLDK